MKEPMKASIVAGVYMFICSFMLHMTVPLWFELPSTKEFFLYTFMVSLLMGVCAFLVCVIIQGWKDE